MKQKFVRNLLFLVLLNLIIKPFYILGIDAGVQNAVGAQEYGLYFALFNLSFLLNIFSDLGIIALCAGLVLGYSERIMILLAWILLNQSMASFLLYLRSNLAGLHLFKQDSIISVLDRFLLIIFCGYALWFRSSGETFKIEWFIWLQTMAYAITVITAFIMVRLQVQKWRFEFSKVFSLTILKKSLPYALLVLLMGLYHRMDSIMLERMLPDGDAASGIYAQGFRFLDALNNFSFLFAILLFPIFSRMLKKKMDITPVLLVASKLLLSGVVIISLTAYIHSLDLMTWRYDENVTEAAKTFMVLISSAFFFAIVLIYGTLLTADGKLKELNYIALSGVVMNFILNFLLIPKYQAYGSAIATLITQGITALAHLILAKRFFNLTINWSVILKLIVLSCFIYGFGYFSSGMDYIWIAKAITTGFLALMLAIAIGLISLPSIMNLIKSKESNED